MKKYLLLVIFLLPVIALLAQNNDEGQEFYYMGDWIAWDLGSCCTVFQS